MRSVDYEIFHPDGGDFFVVRIIGEQAQIIDRFDEREAAEDFIECLTFLNDAPRRFATH